MPQSKQTDIYQPGNGYKTIPKALGQQIMLDIFHKNNKMKVNIIEVLWHDHKQAVHT